MTDNEPSIAINDQFEPRTDQSFLRRVVAATLDYANRPEMPVSILLAGDREIARLHAEFLDDPSPTDVISFEIDDGADLAVSVECARREAARRGHDADAELALYVVHGLLHVCGYDDIDEEDRARMRVAEREVLASLSLHVSPVDE